MPSPPPTESNGCPSSPRRSFCKTVLAGGIAAAAVAVPAAPGVRAVLSATEQKGLAGKFYPLTTLDSLDKTPRKFQVADDVKDAWITIPRQKLGSVFLFKSENGEVRALQTVCPHAGCAIEAATKKNPQNGQEQLMFYCPCHAAHFDLAGVKLDGVSPRDLDTLETKIEDGKVFVRFQNFLTGIAEKKATG